MPRTPSQSWPDRVRAAHEHLVARGHVDPVVAVSTSQGRFGAGALDQRWEVGSVTKLFTALLLAQLVGEGVVGLDTRVPDLLPPGTPLAEGVAHITLENLACHRSGLPRLPPGVLAHSLSRDAMRDPYAALDGARLVDSLAATRVRGTPGRTPVRYSNYGVGLLGYLCGLATGAGYEQSLIGRVLEPLGMGGATFADDCLHQGRYRGKPVGPWHLSSLAGAGGLRCSAGDLLGFLEAVRDCSGPLAPAIAETLRPRSERGRIRVGLGWFLVGQGDLLMHDGGTRGARSEVRVERPTGVCVVVLGDGRGGTARAAGMLLNPR